MSLARSLGWRALSAAHLNGISTALGVALTQALVTAIAGLPAGLAAAGGAVCVSLTDLPNPPRRVVSRLLPAVPLATVVTLAVGLAQHYAPVLMTALIALVGFVCLMAMGWGARAGQLSFTGILAMVFTMAWHGQGARLDAFEHAAFVLVGSLLYGLWALLAAWLLRRRYREQAVAAAMRACAQRLRSRARRIGSDEPVQEASIRGSITDDVMLAEALQTARDHVFAARPSPHSRRQVDLVLGLIELRDLMLSIRLDVDLLGDDAAGRHWRVALADTVEELAATLDLLAETVDHGLPPPAVSLDVWCEQLAARLGAAPAAAHDARQHLVHALRGRFDYMLGDVAAMAQRLAAPDREGRLSPAQLSLFVSPDGWPLAALKSQFTLGSSVMRHALRTAAALGLAYALGLALPWGSHPYWLVLSVAVVLRGNLEQTLSRRNERIIGTVIGCLLVMLLAHLQQPWLLALAFIVSVGVAHAYINLRYKVAATGATLMALLQPLLLAPGSNPAVAERLADTVIGALLAWAFCFVLPSWERRSLQRVSSQLRGALARHAANVLRWAPTPEQQLAQRQSRQQAYAALAALAGTAQRTRVEPRRVRLPEAEIEAVLSRGYRLMALLGAVQQMISRRPERLQGERLLPDLALTLSATVAVLKGEATAPVPDDAPLELDSVASGADWPEHGGHRDPGDLSPWLHRRLRLCRAEAAGLVEAVDGLLRALQAQRR
ncbi:MAG: FUSC family membrane protein [Burkholderiaceae bacterium]